MSKQYRVRLKNGKVVGPLELQEIKVAIKSKKISIKDLFQVFPQGEWVNFDRLKELQITLEENLLIDNQKEKTILMKIDSLININTNDEKVEIKEQIQSLAAQSEQTDSVVDESVNEAEQTTPIQTEEVKEDIDPDSTQFINLNNLNESLEQNNFEAQDVLKQEKIAEINKKKKQIEEIQETVIDSDDDEVEDKNKKKKLIIFAIIIGLLLILLIPEKPKETKAVFKPIKFSYSFPIENSKRNIEESDRLYKEGLQALNLKTYAGMVSAAKSFHSSVELNYKDNPALPKLILTYVDLMPFVGIQQTQSTIVFQLVQVFYQQYFSDVDVNNAHGMFFYHIGKSNTAYKIMKSFLERGNNPTLRYFSDLIKVCLRAGKFSEASELYNKLVMQKISNPYIYDTLYEYEMVNNNSKKAIEWLKQGLNEFPGSVTLMLRKADFDIYSEDYVSLEITLKSISDAIYESSEYYQAKYFELMGVLATVGGKNKDALSFFNKASVLNNKDSFYQRIATLDENKFPEAKDLINRARSHNFVKEVHRNLIEDNLNLALINATNAIDLNAAEPESVIALAMVEKRMGFFQKAINRLEVLRENNPRDADANFNLLETYVEAYKFSDALKLFNLIGATPLREDFRFYSLNGLMNFNMNKLVESAQSYQMSLERNPLNDKDYYFLGEIYYKRKVLNNAKSAYTKAMELNPTETLYRVSYSRILYEESGADVAIGYLRDLMNDFKNDPLILGEIAILYYQTGQVSYFESVLDEIKQLPKKNKRMYEFLIKHSRLNERFDDVIKYSTELLELEPGDIQTRMFLAELLLELKRFDESLEHLFFIRDRLNTYPKLLYNISRLNLLVGKTEQALQYAKEEVAANPGLEDGHILLGNILKDQNDLLSAENHFRESLKINPNSIDGLSGMAFVNVKRNNLDAALDMYQKAIGLAPNNPNIRKSIADVYRLTGQSALAIDNYKVYLELVPESTFKTEIETYMRNFE
jgi:tetratricopeptide (TPR) repeat protein